MRNIIRKCISLTLGAVLTLGLTACQENPEGSIVAHKDMDKLISQAAASDPDRTDAAEVVADAKKADNYQTTIENESLGVKVNVNAQVDVPKTDTLSVYRVEQKKIDQEFLDRVRTELMGDAVLYDGSALRVKTKAEIEQEIQRVREVIEEGKASIQQDPELSEEEKEEQSQQYGAELQNEIDRLQEEYESAPSELDLSQYPSDGKLHTVAEMAEGASEDSYYGWLNSLSSEGDEAFYGINDGSNGQYQFLYVQNNADYSNMLQYRSCPKGYLRQGGVIVGGTALSLDVETVARYDFHIEGDPADFFQEKGLPAPILTNGFIIQEDMEFAPLYENTTITQEEAQRTAEEFLEKIGITDFVFEEGGLFTELVDLAKYSSNEVPYGNYYILHYCRQIDGTALSQSSGMKHQEGWNSNEQYNKQFWPGELIEFRIDDSGIIGFEYHAPLEITETVVEGAALKSFDQVKDTFEQMLPVTLGTTDWTHVVNIDRVRLSYSRISEKDSFDTGLIVPVWSFEGSDQIYSGEALSQTDKGCLLAINAVDGSIINSELGY